MANKLFDSVKMERPRSNVFDLSHDVKLSLNMGELVPVACIEAVPGDKFHLSSDSLLRFAPLVAPVMHRLNVFFHAFFCPNRLVWENWEPYVTNTKIGSALPAFPYITISDYESYAPPELRLMDYLGLPTPLEPGVHQDTNVSAIPFAVYQKIYEEYFMDENLIAINVSGLSDGDNTGNFGQLGALRLRAWEKDYFTSALPWAQKGDAVEIPLGEFKDVHVNWSKPPDDPANPATIDLDYLGNPFTAKVNKKYSPDFTTNDWLYADTSELIDQATTINDLRRAFRLQEFLEKNARGGTRYIENIRAHFGVMSSDKRLQRPEYITGTRSPVVISEIVNTTGTADAPQGNMSGHGISVTSGKSGGYYCEEHGYIMIIMSVLPEPAYQQGIPKHFLKVNDPYELYWPSFANIGEQEIKNEELYAYTTSGPGTFGYTPRYAEYKFMPSRVCGDFRSSLDFWHFGRIFSGDQGLQQDFIECDPSQLVRPFAVTDVDVQKLYAHVYHRIKAVRLMPVYGTPTF